MAQTYTTVDREERSRRRGFPLWIWPLIPLALGALALGMSLRGDDNRAARPANNQMAQTQATQAPNSNAQNNAGNQAGDASGAITDMLQVVNDPNRAALAGKPASFANVTVQSVVGDRTFWVGPSTAQQLLVVLDEDRAGGQAEDTIQVAPGQTVTLTGNVEALPGAEAQSAWGLDAEDTAAVAAQQVYVHAQQVDINGQ